MKFLNLIAVLLLTYSVQAHADLICSNSPTDYVRIHQGQDLVTITTPREERTLTVLGSDTVAVDFDNGIFGPEIQEKWHTYFVFEEDDNIKLIVDEYLATQKLVVKLVILRGEDKIEHLYKSCTRTK